MKLRRLKNIAMIGVASTAFIAPTILSDINVNNPIINAQASTRKRKRINLIRESRAISADITYHNRYTRRYPKDRYFRKKEARYINKKLRSFKSHVNGMKGKKLHDLKRVPLVRRGYTSYQNNLIRKINNKIKSARKRNKEAIPAWERGTVHHSIPAWERGVHHHSVPSSNGASDDNSNSNDSYSDNEINQLLKSPSSSHKQINRNTKNNLNKNKGKRNNRMRKFSNRKVVSKKHSRKYYIKQFTNKLSKHQKSMLTDKGKALFNSLNDNDKRAFVAMSAKNKAKFEDASPAVRNYMLYKAKNELVSNGELNEEGKKANDSAKRKAAKAKKAKAEAEKKHKQDIASTSRNIKNNENQLRSLVRQRDDGNHSRSVNNRINKLVSKIEHEKDHLSEIDYGNPLSYQNGLLESGKSGWVGGKPSAPKNIDWSNLASMF